MRNYFYNSDFFNYFNEFLKLLLAFFFLYNFVMQILILIFVQHSLDTNKILEKSDRIHVYLFHSFVQDLVLIVCEVFKCQILWIKLEMLHFEYSLIFSIKNCIEVVIKYQILWIKLEMLHFEYSLFSSMKKIWLK